MRRPVLFIALCLATLAAGAGAQAGAAERTTPEGVPVPALH